MNKDFLLIIPARLGSKGIPKKNFLTLGEKKVIDYTIEHSLGFRDLCDIVITTDNFDFLAELAPHYVTKEMWSLARDIIQIDKGLFLHLRSQDLSKDETPIISVIQEIISLRELVGSPYLGVVLMQPTVPFRSIQDQNRLRHYLETSANEGSSFVTFRNVSDAHPSRMYTSDGEGSFRNEQTYAKYSQTRRQELPSLFLRDGCYYFIGSGLIRQGLQFSSNPEGYVRKFPWTMNLDEEEDFLLAQAILSHYSTVLFGKEGMINETHC